MNEIFDMTYWTMYNLEEISELGSADNIGRKPTYVEDTFHSQFQLNLNTYIDSNNYIQHNSIDTKENRLAPYFDGDQYQFLTIRKAHSWTGHKYFASGKYITESNIFKEEE